jgi:CO/xanthine dehydrogenase Mo-binding subunit
MVTIEKYFAIHDIGKVINPVTLKGQINGGVAMGIGYSLMEDLEIHDGIIENTNYDSYIIPTSMDVPDIYSEAYESIEPLGPFGAKGTGEPVLTPVPACIGNAIRFATGKRLTSLPFSLEKIVLGKDLYKYGK